MKAAGISEMLNLRVFNTDRRKADCRQWTRLHIRMAASRCDDKKIIASLRAIRDRKGNIVIHCKHGADRTGLIAALYRIVFQNWRK